MPLATLVEAIHDADLLVCFQVVAQPYEDWSGKADLYIDDLEEGSVTAADQLWDVIWPRDPETPAALA